MGRKICIPVIFLLLLHTTLGVEKVMFGQPAPIKSEPRQDLASDQAPDISAKDGGRQAKVFQFPGAAGSQRQDSRTHTAYVLPSTYEETEDRFSGAAEDNNRLMSLLPSFGENGMQVGLDFKLPFFSIPYGKMFSALSPSVGSGFFGSSYGSTGSATSTLGSLSTGLLGSGTGLATAAAMAATAALLYPKVSSMFSLDGKGIFRDGGSPDDFLHNMNSVLSQFNIDGESCVKVALCTMGNAKRSQQRSRGRDLSTTPADILEDVLNLPQVKRIMSKYTLTQARDFGGSGGDCEYFNAKAKSKCPIAATSFQKFFSTLG